jgi:hypothetical protein
VRGGREVRVRSRCEERKAPVGSNRSPMRAATFRSRRSGFFSEQSPRSKSCRTFDSPIPAAAPASRSISGRLAARPPPTPDANHPASRPVSVLAPRSAERCPAAGAAASGRLSPAPSSKGRLPLASSGLRALLWRGSARQLRSAPSSGRRTVVGRLPLLDLPHRCPTGPYAGEERERPVLVESKPNRRPGAVWPKLVLGEACERHDAAVLDAKPSAPVWRRDVADIGDARIGVAALQGEDGRRHAPSSYRKLTGAVFNVADDGGRIVGKNARDRRKVAGRIAHSAGEVSDPLRAFGDRIEVAHRSKGTVLLGFGPPDRFLLCSQRSTILPGCRTTRI